MGKYKVKVSIMDESGVEFGSSLTQLDTKEDLIRHHLVANGLKAQYKTLLRELKIKNEI